MVTVSVAIYFPCEIVFYDAESLNMLKATVDVAEVLVGSPADSISRAFEDDAAASAASW
jgi:hypothetical protein